ncbi:MAG: hypothetical protein MSA57_07630 [Ruminococcus sp.]|nr:hypothetical protein [Ruminococcus sp.]
MIVSSKVALQNHSIVRVQTVAERQSLFSFAYFSFFSKKKPDEKDDSILSLPNSNLFPFAYFSFFSKKKPDEKDDSMLSLPNDKFFFLLPAFLFLARRIK